MNPIRRALATVGRITETLIPNQLMLADRVASWPDALMLAEEQSEVLEPSDFPGCNCAGAQAADLADHRPACAARAAGESPAGVRIPPTMPPVGRPTSDQIHSVAVIIQQCRVNSIDAYVAANRIVDMLSADAPIRELIEQSNPGRPHICNTPIGPACWCETFPE